MIDLAVWYDRSRSVVIDDRSRSVVIDDRSRSVVIDDRSRSVAIDDVFTVQDAHCFSIFM